MPDHRGIVPGSGEENSGAGNTRNILRFDPTHELVNRDDLLAETLRNRKEKPFFEQLLQEGARNLLFNHLNKKVKPWLSRRIEKRRQLHSVRLPGGPHRRRDFYETFGYIF